MSLGGIVARNIRRLREERGLTQEELAVRIRINRNYVGMIERQENSPTVAMLERIATALGIEPARLFGEKPVGRKGGGCEVRCVTNDSRRNEISSSNRQKFNQLNDRR